MKLEDAKENIDEYFNAIKPLVLFETLKNYKFKEMKEKILVLGDIHGRTCWKDIIERENPDLTVFLGDYVSSHDGISGKDQIFNLFNILEYKESNPDKVILLRGNHDTQHLGYYWADCSGRNIEVLKWMSQPEIKEKFLKNTQWMYVVENYLLSHAGVSEEWLKYYNINFDDINDLEPSEAFGFTPSKMSDYYGDSSTQPLTWIRPWALEEYAIDYYNQIVGHTRPHSFNSQPMLFKSNKNTYIYLCDILPYMYITMDKNEKNEYEINYKKYE